MDDLLFQYSPSIPTLSANFMLNRVGPVDRFAGPRTG
jgi:hypothetical protein